MPPGFSTSRISRRQAAGSVRCSSRKRQYTRSKELPGQAGVARVGRAKRDVGQAGAPQISAACSICSALTSIPVTLPGGPDHFAEHAGDGAHAAAEIGHVHAGLQSGLQQQAAAGRSVDVVQDEEAVYGRRAAGQGVFALACLVVAVSIVKWFHAH